MCLSLPVVLPLKPGPLSHGDAQHLLADTSLNLFLQTRSCECSGVLIGQSYLDKSPDPAGARAPFENRQTRRPSPY